MVLNDAFAQLGANEVPATTAPDNFAGDPTDEEGLFGEENEVVEEDELAEVAVPDNEIHIFLPDKTVPVKVEGPVALRELFASQHIAIGADMTVWVNETPVDLDLVVAPGTVVAISKVNKGG